MKSRDNNKNMAADYVFDDDAYVLQLIAQLPLRRRFPRRPEAGGQLQRVRAPSGDYIRGR